MVTGKARYAQEEMVEILVSQAAIRKELFVYAGNVLLLSLVISSLTAFFIYLQLSGMIVAPVKRLTRNMMAFEENPEDRRNLLSPSDRLDEIGVAERSLAALEARIQSLLAERRRLAALGAGISKISHDLRNILASAQLMSDRLAKSDDPRVRKLSPRLISSLDRAITLSRDTLNYARMGPSSLNRQSVNLHKLVDDVFADAASMDVALDNETPADLRLDADPTQLYRALMNLVRNAVEAMTAEAPGAENSESEKDNERALRVAVTATTAGDDLHIDVRDTGPGVPEEARAGLFVPFKGSMKAGGSGLGVAIAGEIAKAHGGRLDLAENGADGATFRLTLPLAAPTGRAIAANGRPGHRADRSKADRKHDDARPKPERETLETETVGNRSAEGGPRPQ